MGVRFGQSKVVWSEYREKIQEWEIAIGDCCGGTSRNN